MPPRWVALPVVLSLALVLDAAQPTLSLRLEPAVVTAGQPVTAVVRAPAGSTVAITTDAPAVTPHTLTATGTEQRVTLGPFVRHGDFRVSASAGGLLTAANLRVAFPQDPAATTPPANGATTPFQRTADALLDALNGARTGVSRLPGREPTIEETKRALDALHEQLAAIRRAAAATDETFDAVREQLDKDTAASREAKDEFSSLERELNQVLDEQARQVREFGRDAERPDPDSCAAAMAAAAALHGQRSAMRSMQGGVRDLAAGQGRREAGATPASAAGWRAVKAKIEDLVRTGQAGSYAEAERSIGQATGSQGLGGFSERQCDKFTGEWSGTTHVEALDKGQAFYGLVNEWRAQVEVSAVRGQPGAQADRPLRGTLTGQASQFKVVNQLRTLYAGRPAQHIEFLTTDPSPAQQQGATFVAALDGFIRGNRMTLKVRPGGVDYAGRVTGKMAAVVIPMASPVPLVQTYDVMFQGGNWQLSRAIGPNGTHDQPLVIISGGDKRLVRASYPRSLDSEGARGRFTIDIALCNGC